MNSNRKNISSELTSVREKFALFLQLLERNNRVLKVMSDMEEKAQGDYLFDINYIRNSINEIREGVIGIIDALVGIGGRQYRALRSRFQEINEVLETVMPGNQPIVNDSLTVPFDKLNRTRAFSVGSKNAQLGELKTILKLPVPEGFAITARAYLHFVEASDLQGRISRRIESIDFRSHDDLVRVGREIRDMIMASPVPDDLVEEIMAAYHDLVKRSSQKRFSMRSSAIGEDTLFSFAGQYASYLNVREVDLIDRYREVLASKFTPQAIYYFLSHSLSEAELAMSVGCVSMIDAAAAGVVYTRDPINAKDESILINSIFGLGKYIVNGLLTPDEFRVSREDGHIISAVIADKPVRLVTNPDGGTVEEAVPAELQRQPSLTDAQIRQLAEYADTLENHYRTPQDIEWSIDRQGRLFLLQSRPLHIIKSRTGRAQVDTGRMRPLLAGGTTVCPGAGIGRVYHVESIRDLPDVPDGVVLVAPHPFPGLVTVMGKIEALISSIGGLASHMATIAREYHIPTLVGVADTARLSSGMLVTVDATGGVIYDGDHPDLVAARKPDIDLFEDSGIHKVLDRVLDLVSPLRLMHPTDVDFIAENCGTFHDITRFAHQKAMEEMFRSAKTLEENDSPGFALKSDLPVNMKIVYLDYDEALLKSGPNITEDDIATNPMKYFWDGVKLAGWPMRLPRNTPMVSMESGIAKKAHKEYSENSYAVLGKEYMMLSLRMGYHFTTVEAMCAAEPNKNYIQMQYKDGGASLDRRIRRIKLLTEILSRLGFAQQRKGDYLHSVISYQDQETMARKLTILGRLTIMTKQLDMALSNDAVAEWYTKDFMKKLGLTGKNEM